MARQDLTGTTIGRVTVIEYSHKDKKRNAHWVCKCHCGNIFTTKGYRIKNGDTRSCGCLKTQNMPKDLTGNRYGQLTVTGFSHTTKNGAYWNCLCHCGNTKVALAHHLKQGHITTCSWCDDLTGMTFGKLKVIGFSHTKRYRRFWKCVCVCGTIKTIETTSLKKIVRSCGCIKSKGEMQIASWLNEKGYSFTQQYCFDDCVRKRPLPFDFAVHMQDGIRLIEYQGAYHFKHQTTRNSNYKIVADSDFIKETYCINCGIPFIAIPFFTKSIVERLEWFLSLPRDMLLLP